MKLENNISIKGEKDSCQIRLNDDGSVLVGSIILQPNEIEEFTFLIGSAIAKLQAGKTKKAE